MVLNLGDFTLFFVVLNLATSKYFPVHWILIYLLSPCLVGLNLATSPKTGLVVLPYRNPSIDMTTAETVHTRNETLPASTQVLPPDQADLFSEGGEAMKLHIEGSLTIPTTGI